MKAPERVARRLGMARGRTVLIAVGLTLFIFLVGTVGSLRPAPDLPGESGTAPDGSGLATARTHIAPTPLATAIAPSVSLAPRPPTVEARAVPAGALRPALDFPAIRSGDHYASDASIAVGLNDVLVATNDVFALYEKTGRLIDRVRSLDMFASVASSAGHGYGDPRAIFDRSSGRYFLAFVLSRPQPGCQAGECAIRWLLAVSRTSAPRTLRQEAWHLYTFDGTLEGGRPSATSDGDFLVMGTDARNLVMHGYVTRSSTGQAFTKIWLFDKAALTEGRHVARPERDLVDVRDPATGAPVIRLLPATMQDDPGSVFLAGRGTSGCSLVVGAVSGPASQAQLALRSIPVSGQCDRPPPSPQAGGGTPIFTFGDVMSPPIYVGGRIWLTHAVGVKERGSLRAGIRVVQIDVSRWPATPTVVLDRTIVDDAGWLSFPAIAATATGNAAVVAVRSSFTEPASVWYTGRLGGDAAGTFRPGVTLKRGEANLNTLFSETRPGGSTFLKFADFNGAAVDPDDGSAWVIGTYVSDVCEWGTWVARLDWSVAEMSVGESAGASVLRSGPPCSPLPRSFALRFLRTGAASSYASAPVGSIAYVFEYGGADLGMDPARAPRILEPDRSLRWEIPSPGTFVLFLTPGVCPPGACKVVVQLPDGRETGSFFTVPP